MILYTGGSGTAGSFVLDTRELRQVLGEVPLSAPEVSEWIAGFLEEQTAELLREETS